jgi:hypothetical protein
MALVRRLDPTGLDADSNEVLGLYRKVRGQSLGRKTSIPLI